MMTPQQKLAWYNLTVTGVTLCLILIAYPLLGRGALGFLGFLGLQGLGGLFYGKKKGTVTWDEREQQIHSRSILAAWAVLWLYLSMACMITWGIHYFYQHQYVITIDVLPLILFGAGIFVVLTQSIATLVQYGRERGDAKD